MKIVILDGYTLNPGDLDWSPLACLGDLSVHDRTARSEILLRATGAEIVLTNKTPLAEETLQALPGLRYVGVLATGYNVVDVAAAKSRGIVVTNVPGYGTASVAQHVWALILELVNHVGRHAASVAEGGWTRCPDFCYWTSPLTELSEKKLGVVGLGAIGRAVAEIGRAFGMEIIAHTRTPRPGVEQVSLDDLFRRADLISLHCPLTEETKGLVNSRRLSSMKPTALLINTGRGPLVVESDLAEALNSGIIAGAGLDVLGVEPPNADNPLLTAKNCLITPHQAWATQAARQRLLDIAAANIRGFLAGRLQNVVNA